MFKATLARHNMKQPNEETEKRVVHTVNNVRGTEESIHGDWRKKKTENAWSATQTVDDATAS